MQRGSWRGSVVTAFVVGAFTSAGLTAWREGWSVAWPPLLVMATAGVVLWAAVLLVRARGEEADPGPD